MASNQIHSVLIVVWPYHEVFYDSPQPLKLGSVPQQYHSVSSSGCFVYREVPVAWSFGNPHPYAIHGNSKDKL